MKRVTFRIVLFLLLGAIVNVLVAWTCAASINPFEAELQNAMRTSPDGYWEAFRYDRFGTTWVASTRSKTWDLEQIVRGAPEQLVPKWSGLATWSDNFQLPNVALEMRYVDGRGWPMRSLWCEVGGHIWVNEPGGGNMVPQEVQGGIETSLSHWPLGAPPPLPRVLPLRPIPLGFVFNTVFYGSVIWIALFGIPLLRRYSRTTRGLCPNCGYNLRRGGSGVCSECGWKRDDGHSDCGYSSAAGSN